MDQEYLGRSGDLGGYRIEVGEDRVRVLKDGVVVLDHAVPPHGERSIGAFVAGAAELRLAWGRLPDGDEMIAISDAAAAAEGAPSYVVNITDEDLSGWGHGGGLLGSPDASDA